MCTVTVVCKLKTLEKQDARQYSSAKFYFDLKVLTTKSQHPIKSPEEKYIILIGWDESFASVAIVENGDPRPIKEGDAVLRSTESEKNNIMLYHALKHQSRKDLLCFKICTVYDPKKKSCP